MPRMLCNHKDCPVHEEVATPRDNIFPNWYCRQHRGPTAFLPRPGCRDCQFCKHEISAGDMFRHSGGRLYHVDCLIRFLKDKIHDLKNPLTGEVEDDSIPRAFKKIRSALREQSRINNKIAYERPLSNSWYGTESHPKSGMYKDRMGVTWGDVQDIASKAVRDAVKELEKLT